MDLCKGQPLCGYLPFVNFRRKCERLGRERDRLLHLVLYTLYLYNSRNGAFFRAAIIGRRPLQNAGFGIDGVDLLEKRKGFLIGRGLVLYRIEFRLGYRLFVRVAEIVVAYRRNIRRRFGGYVVFSAACSG